MNLHHPFNKAIIKLLIIILILQGFPFFELSRTYRWDIQNYYNLFHSISQLLLPKSAQAETCCDNQCFQKNLNHIISKQHSDGHWSLDATSNISDIQITSEIIFLLKECSVNTKSAYLKAVEWIDRQHSFDTDILSSKINVLAVTDRSVKPFLTILAQAQNFNGGWGKTKRSVSDVYHTSLALIALHKGHNQNKVVCDNGIKYLLQRQNIDGSFGLFSGSRGKILQTALVVIAVKTYSKDSLENKEISKKLNHACEWLLQKQNDEGAWIQKYAPHDLTSIAAKALHICSYPFDIKKTCSYLDNICLNHSKSDIYTSTMALRSLKNLECKINQNTVKHKQILNTSHPFHESSTQSSSSLSQPGAFTTNQLPVAYAGSYSPVVKNQPLGSSMFLDGSNSYDPDGDPISYHWYGPFEAVSGNTPLVFIPEGRYTVSLVVNDDSACSTADTTSLEVFPEFALSIKMQDQSVVLSWDYQKPEMNYGIFRSDDKHPSQFSKIGETTSADMTYIDTEQLENDTTYLYAVSASDENNYVFSEVASIHTKRASDINPSGTSKQSCDTGKGCFISVVSPAMADSSNNANSPPVIWSIPITQANVSIIYNYDVNATDPDDDRLTYHLFKHPDGMEIDPTTGHISWIPQSETPEVITVQVKDSKGAIDSQTFTIMSFDTVNYVNVPKIVGLSKHAAEDTIYSAGLNPGKISYQHTANISTDTVIDQFPQESSSVLAGATVDMVLSKTQMKKIPNVIGQLQSDAEKIIVENHFTVGKVSEVSSDTVPEGHVVVQTPAPGNMAVIGSSVDIAISSGKSKLSVPDVVGIHYSQAVPTIIMSGLLPGNVTEESSETIQAGIVMHQAPKSGTMVELETKIDLVVCSGIPKVIVPNLLNKERDVATQMITDSKLTVGRIGHQYHKSVPKNCVIKQDPSHGSAVIRYSAINIVISQGPRPKVTVPNVEGLHKKEAEEMLTNTSLFVGQVSFQLHDNIPAIHVISQSPKAGESILVGSSVDLVISKSHPPVITSSPPQQIYVGQRYFYPVIASDPENDPLHYSLQESPKSMVIDKDNGTITWIPDQEGIFSVSLQVSDEKGGLAEQSYTISVKTVTIDDDFVPPHIKLTVLRPVVLVGDTVGIVVSATDNLGIQALALSVNDENLFIDESGKGYYSSSQPGIFQAKAKAIDLAGNEASAQAEIRFIIEGQDDYPEARISDPAYGTQISEPTNIIGTASDKNLVRYTLAYSPKGSDEFIVFSKGTTSIENGVLGRLDPTMMKNGFYTIRLTAENTGGKYVYHDVVYEITGNMKVGNFTIGFTDLMIPVSGIPITISRNYDSRDKTKGDFGIGWTLGLQNIEISESETMGKHWGKQHYGMWALMFSLIPATPRTITVNFPDGRKHGFYMALAPNEWSSLAPIFIESTAFFKPVKGTFSTLESLDNNHVEVYCAQDAFDLTTDGTHVYDPKRFKLTDVDGSFFIFHKEKGLQHIQDANGNTIDIGHDGIIHSSGKSVKFIRDYEDRIVNIIDPMGNSLSYEYDGNGNLIRFTDQEGSTTRFTYNNTHGLVDIIDPRGVKVARTIYDDQGRVIAHIDAEGNRVEYDHNMEGRQEVVTDSLGRITVFEYDEDGNIIKKVDPYGNSTTCTYDSNGNKTSETDPLGNTKRYLYDERNNMIEETDQMGNTTVRTYNEMNLKTSSTDPLGRKIKYEYNSMGQLTKKTLADGNVLTKEYDERGNLISTTGCCGNTSKQYEYNEFGYIVKETDSLGNVIKYTYDQNGNQLSKIIKRYTSFENNDIIVKKEYNGRNQVVKEIYPDGSYTAIEYNAFGKESAIIDNKGFRKEYKYDLKGNLAEVTYPDGSSINETFDSEGNKISRIDRNGNIQQFEYNKLNQISKIITPSIDTVKECYYDESGRLTKIVNENGSTIKKEYNALGQPTKMTDALGNVTRYSYDSKGNQTSMTDAKGNVFSIEYDQLDREVKRIYPDGTYIQTQYAPGTYDKRKLSETDQAGNTTYYEYDDNGNLIKVSDSLGNKTHYSYDELGNKTSQTDPNGNITRFEYDNLGRLAKHILPSGHFEKYSYDVNGNIIKKKDFNGNTFQFKYDKLNNLLSKIYPNDSKILYEYTQNGQLKTITSQSGITSYTYNSMGALVNVKMSVGIGIRYSYDKKGNRISVKIPSGTTRYEYDENNRITMVTNPDGGIAYYTYDENGNRSSITYPNGTITVYQYDKLNRLIYLENRTSEVGKLISSYKYTLGPAGNRICIEENTGRTVHYTYDNLYRLIKEDIIDPKLGNETITYSYDSFGNRLKKTDSQGTTVYVYNENNQLIQEKGVNGLITYKYDSNGNLIKKSAGKKEFSYKYNYENKLIEMKTGNDITTYEYDSDGIRISSKTNGKKTNYVVDKNRPYAQVLEERKNDNSLIVSYVYGDDLISQNRSGIYAYYHYDGQMSTRHLTDENREIMNSYIYDAFGKIIHKKELTINNYLYSGEQYDPNVGFYYLRARYYDQNIGRFTSSDPYMGNLFDPISLHKYLYANSNPVMFSDPSGKISIMSYVLKGLKSTQDAIAFAISYSGVVTAGLSISLAHLYQSFAKSLPEVAWDLIFNRTRFAVSKSKWMQAEFTYVWARSGCTKKRQGIGHYILVGAGWNFTFIGNTSKATARVGYKGSLKSRGGIGKTPTSPRNLLRFYGYTGLRLSVSTHGFSVRAIKIEIFVMGSGISKKIGPSWSIGSSSDHMLSAKLDFIIMGGVVFNLYGEENDC
jgi:RHS repeat-associated protein